MHVKNLKEDGFYSHLSFYDSIVQLKLKRTNAKIMIKTADTSKQIISVTIHL